MLVLVAHVRQLFLLPAADSDLGIVDQALYLGTSFGHGAVLVFFVLSGYFVGGSVIRQKSTGTFSWGSYAASRGTRLWIVLIPAIILTAILDRVGFAFLSDRAVYGPDSNTAENNGMLSALGNVFFLQPNIVEPYGSNHPLWSLGVEACYYILFPLFIIGLTTGSISKRIFSGGLIAVIFFVLGWAGGALFMSWLLGAAVAFKQESITSMLRRLSPHARVASKLGALVLVFAAMAYDRVQKAEPEDVGLSTWLVVVSTAVLIVTLLDDVAAKSAIANGLLAAGSRISAFSYSLYATHMPIMWLGHSFIFASDDAAWEASPLAWIGTLAVSVACTFLAWLFYLATERNTSAVRAGVWRLVGRSRTSVSA